MATSTPFTEYVHDLAKFAIAYVFMSFIFTLNAVALSFPITGLIKPPLLLIVIYYWSIYRPTLLPPWLVFAAGALMDFISGLPLGLHALVYVAAHWLVADQRRFFMSQSFVMIWAGYALVSVGAGLAQWGIFGVLNWYWPPLNDIAYSTFLGIALFPILSVLLHMTHKILPEGSTSLE